MALNLFAHAGCSFSARVKARQGRATNRDGSDVQ
jgi:hypothetical protein